jgi:hypothetical protein
VIAAANQTHYPANGLEGINPSTRVPRFPGFQNDATTRIILLLVPLPANLSDATPPASIERNRTNTLRVLLKIFDNPNVN